MDTLGILVGFLIGVVASAIAVELGLKKLFMAPTQTKLTSNWTLAELGAPLVVAKDATTVGFPDGAQIVTAGGVNPEGFTRRQHRANPSATGNFMIHPDRERALLFLGPIESGTLAMSTVDPELVGRLRAEHHRLWERGTPYVEELPMAAAVRRNDVLVRTTGLVQEVVAYRDRFLLRLTDGTNVLGALLHTPLDVQGKHVQVTGRVRRGTSGYPLIETEEVRVARLSRDGRSIAGLEPALGAGTGPESAPVSAASRTAQTSPGKPVPGAASRPAVAPKMGAQQDEGTGERILRVSGSRTSRHLGVEAAIPPEAAEPEAAPPEPQPSSAAERARAKDRVIIHR